MRAGEFTLRLDRAVERAWLLDARLGLLLAALTDRCELSLVAGIGTARIGGQGDQRRIELDPVFLEKQLQTDDDLIFVLAHEVLHRLQGDLDSAAARRSERGRLAANLVADIRINSWLLLNFFPSPPPLLRRLYRGASFPGILLLPPTLLVRSPLSGLPLHDLVARAAAPNHHVAGAAARALRGKVPPGVLPQQVSAWYVAAWLGESCRASLTTELLLFLPEGLEAPVFLGDHEGQGEEDEEGEALTGLEGLEEILGYGKGRESTPGQLALDSPSSRAIAKLRRELQRVLSPDSSARVEPSERQATPIPRPSRRDLYLLAAGSWPGLFHPRVPDPRSQNRKARVYVDVSGSTRAAQGRIYGLLDSLRALLADPIHMFSTEVNDLPLQGLSEGFVRTTLGTEFGCVLDHAAESRTRKALVITDGYGPVPSASRQRARQAGVEVHVLLTQRHARSRPGDLCSLATSVRNLP
ncbi:MAG: hypothetical protein JKY65_28135 [Planctomycetes bacterium]|nr:hypothetical protein [Planctomycetota bacterium]